MAVFSKRPESSKKTDLKSQSPDQGLYIATMGHVFPWCEDGKFYPTGTSERDRLKYYASKFNSVMIRSTFFGQPKTEIYSGWLDSVRDSQAFRFIVSAPKLLSYSKSAKDASHIWNFFWEGNGKRGGCELLHKGNRLGCILLEFSPAFNFSSKNIGKLKSLSGLIPSDVRCVA